MTLDGSHDLRLVALSVIIAAFVSYTALRLMGRVSFAVGNARRLWLGASALTMGAGIWSMHFVGMLALRLPVPMAYDVALTLLSAVPAVAGAAVGMSLVANAPEGRPRFLPGGLFLGAGIAAMHYIGMTGMRLPATISYDPMWVSASIVIAIAASSAALWLACRLRHQAPLHLDRESLGGALLMGIAVSGMHYTGMAAATFQPTPLESVVRPMGFDPLTLATLVAVVTLAVLAAALGMSTADRHMAETSEAHRRELEQIREDLEKKVNDRTKRLREAVELLKRDIKAREKAEIALQTEKERVQITLNSIADAVITTNSNGEVDYLNPVAERMLGWSREEAEGHTLTDVCQLLEDPRDETSIKPLDPGYRESKTMERSRYILVRPDGRRLVVEEATTLLRDDQGNPTGTVTVLHDISQAQKLADELRYHASHDPLTGLVNRREFERRLEVALNSARKERLDHALAYIDLDQFKVVNDICGHIAGDSLLRELAAVLRENIRDEDTLARLGGDEFGLLLEGCPLKKAQQVAENLRRVVDEFSFTWNGKAFSVGASIGLVPITFESDTIEGLLSAADVACYAAKDLGRNRVEIYHPTNEELAKRHGEMHWVSGVNKALQQDRFVLFAQTIKPLRNGHDEPPHREILIRIVESDGTLIPPGAFIPPAERYDLMPKVDRWVISNLFASLADYIRADDEEEEGESEVPELGTIAVNLSAASINDELFIHFIRDQFREHGVPPESICFEITETAVMASLERARNFVREIRSMGCRLALDDFGSGMSSFNYLKNLPVDYLKIDGGFVRDLSRDAVDQTIIESINRTGHALGIRTIAEMVEEPESLEILRRIGVDYAQGLAIDRPKPLFQQDAIIEQLEHDELPEDLSTTLVGIERPR
ncbi:MAG: hypothetical protein Kow006_16390 [Gammaproteobacteria bacterium]